ncbi:UvrD-helicase domain-containing protein [Spirulina major CS-329]|uniref:UvrD-helicase domain-containing protein n=1 Tax=Spirulina TaxID=1154 RepID=UPI00232F5762|nr:MULTISPECIES: UvrD-helicase domain-containing protein [Spirulina]MDB9494550.1 UvrD-helicase domain-containing protein [Spirulina subsalsa CS-330]MDB9504970.1 UvrD-helicase domain-containing protein [Spirulina major CS-329]
MQLTEQQAQAAQHPGSVAVTAGAGTGKTHMLAERYLYFLAQGYSPLNIVAVTFTDKAAQELRSRIRRTIKDRMGDRPDTLAELEAAPISTLHALAQHICRDHPEAAQVPPNFTVQDEILGPVWRARALIEAIAQLPSPLPLPFSRLCNLFEALLKNPSTAMTALECDHAAWLPILAPLRQDQLTALITSDEWIAAKDLLTTYAATSPSDKLDGYRLTVLDAIHTLEQGEQIEAAFKAIQKIDLRGINDKKWGDQSIFKIVKTTVTQFRDLIKSEINKGIITLEPNAIDDQTDALLPALREAFYTVYETICRGKADQRVLDFNDLEIHALQALENSEVQAHYAQRWTVFLIDEFQDTSLIQGQFLERLTTGAIVTIVGDVKQSIYGFRGAAVQVFQTWQQRIHGRDRPVELSVSFRTHTALLTQINQVFAPLLDALHQPLTAHRCAPLNPAPRIELYTVQPTEAQTKDPALDTSVEACRRVEAEKIAALIAEMLDQSCIHDPESGEVRRIRPGDVAVLARSWKSLDLPAAAIASRGIPVVQGGDGKLLETPEARDGWAMLQTLADGTDNLALATVLRSPFFAVSDRTLYHFAQSLPEKTTWWQHLAHSTDPQLRTAFHCLKQLRGWRRTETPTRLLQWCDRLTGYTAVIANLPNAARRLADWRGFGELVRSLESGHGDAIAVVRHLKAIAAIDDLKVPRPALAADNAVTLTTIHSAKGLEWPVVFVVDLSRESPNQSPRFYIDADLGLGLKLDDETGTAQASALYTVLAHRHNQRAQAEAKRLLYVALTRARDRLILTAAEPKGPALDLLKPGLETCVDAIAIPFDPAPLGDPVSMDAVEPAPDSLPTIATAGFSDLPITALTDYALCPLRFKFNYVDGHPGYYKDGSEMEDLEMDDLEMMGSDRPSGRTIGKITHKALEQNITTLADLQHRYPNRPASDLQDALNYAQRFRTAPEFAAYRQGDREVPVQLEREGILFNGSVDLVGADFVLDFKTDRTRQPHHHRFQLWAYSRATPKPHAHIAYLRHDHLHSFTPQDLENVDHEAQAMIQQLAQGNFTATPERDRCSHCPYSTGCDAQASP